MDNTQKFTGKADVYAQYRPSYPEAYIDYLIAENHLTADSLVVDIGSGTGKLAERLLAKQLKVTAVEPNTDMRRTAEERLGGTPGYLSVTGTAENTGLPEACANLITVAQAFHWFDPVRFQAECKRILKPGANVALVWNTQGPYQPLNHDIRTLFQRLYPDSREAPLSGVDRTSPSVLAAFFKNGAYKTRTFPNNRILTREEFIGYNLSKSYSPQPSDTQYTAFVEALRSIFDRYAKDGKIELCGITRNYLGQI